MLADLGDVPIVLMISACFSGDFLTGQDKVIRPNRIVMVAAAEDRSSFGCGAGFFMPEWDDSLVGVLAGLDAGSTWQDAARSIEADIAGKDRNFAPEYRSQPAAPAAPAAPAFSLPTPRLACGA